jgi:DNA-binding NarL/FixJ family response regulator
MNATTPLTVGRIVFSNRPPGMFMTTVEERREAMKRKPLPVVATPVPVPVPVPAPAPVPAPEPIPVASLKPKEVLLLIELCKGKSDHATARAMGISQFTLKTRMARVRKKLRVQNRVQLVVYAFRNGIVS